MRYIIVMKPNIPAVLVEVKDGPLEDLEQMKSWIDGGYMEVIPVAQLGKPPLPDDLTVVCDEDGRLKRLEPNIRATFITGVGIVGPAFVFVSKPPDMLGIDKALAEQIVEWLNQ